MNLEDRFYTSTEVAEILGVSLRSVYRYLEENKITAEVKTATGRHRFTKKNIMDFLYPSEDSQKDTVKTSTTNVSNTDKDDFVVTQRSTVSSTVTSVPVSETATEEKEAKEPEVIESTGTEQPEESNVENEAPEVDWLAKFRAAAEKHRAESNEVETTNAAGEKAEEASTPQVSTPSYENTAQSLGSIAQEEIKPSEAKNVFHYKSNSITGLKELAQQINAIASKSSVSYAFTMNAGLSLHKLIRPFSKLHVYIQSKDREFFEKSLDLVEVAEENSQIVLMLDKDEALGTSKSIHGLSVVSDSRLKSDLLSIGELDLAAEM